MVYDATTDARAPRGSRPLVGVIDPALKDPATVCFNEIVKGFPEMRFTLHHPALFPALPTMDEAESWDAIIILGSAAFVTDHAPWMKKVVDLAVAALRRGIPVLGCCFGHQLVAQALGAEVDYVTPEKEKFSGLREVRFSSEFLTYEKGATMTLAVTHRQEIKALPAEFEVCGSSPCVEFEAIRHRILPFWGVQAHPEASRFFMTEYLGGFSDQEMTCARAHGAEVIGGFLMQVRRRGAT